MHVVENHQGVVDVRFGLDRKRSERGCWYGTNERRGESGVRCKDTAAGKGVN